MITNVRVKNFRSLADVNVELGKLTVLVGQNGAGKSSFIDSLRFVRDALNTNLEEAVKTRHGMEAIRRWSPDESCETEIGITFNETSLDGESLWVEYAFALLSEPNGEYRVSWERGRFGTAPDDVNQSVFHRKGNDWLHFSGNEAEKIKLAASDNRLLIIPRLRSFAAEPVDLSELLASGYYDIAPQTLRPPQLYTFGVTLSDNGDNLASVLYALCAYDEVKQELLPPLQSVVTGVSDIRVQPVGGYLVTELKHDDVAKGNTANGNAPWFALNRESNGTLRWLALLVALNQRTMMHTVAPRLVALEEPETSLHPGALAVIADELYAARERFQIMVTTQSPDLIARLKAEDLRVVERIKGATQIGPLDAMQRETIQEQLFTAGDLLRIEGLRREHAEVARA